LGRSAVYYIKKREGVYKKMFGKECAVFHEPVPMVPHIDVYVFPPGYRKRPFYTLVTGGMSDLRMNAPHGMRRSGSRAELILYVRKLKKEYADLLRWLAVFPHEYKSWVYEGHTVSNGVPPSPLFKGSELSVVLLLPSLWPGDFKISGKVSIGGDPVNFWWVFPITERECNLKLVLLCQVDIE
jgi:hypothetical protein